LKIGHAPSCVASAPSTIQVGVFQPLVPQPRPATQLPFRLRFDRLTYRVARGSILRYRVTVTNASRKPFRFRACPAYFEALGGSDRHELHILNCRPVGTLAPGAARVFAIELRVPRTTTPGATELFFELGLGTYEPAQQSNGPTVLVTAR
jgi:hypothetical protein